MNPEHRLNLQKLVDGLKNWTDDSVAFNMAQYSDGSSNEICGTVGCAVGHGPYCGIPKQLDESWDQYTERVFGVVCFDKTWYYLFGTRWANTEYNNRIDTADRIQHFIDNDGRVPDDFITTYQKTYAKYW